MDTVWIVTYIENNEPTVIPFDNQEAAHKCFEWLKDKYDWVGVDCCEVATTFG